MTSDQISSEALFLHLAQHWMQKVAHCRKLIFIDCALNKHENITKISTLSRAALRKVPAVDILLSLKYVFIWWLATAPSWKECQHNCERRLLDLLGYSSWKCVRALLTFAFVKNHGFLYYLYNQIKQAHVQCVYFSVSAMFSNFSSTDTRCSLTQMDESWTLLPLAASDEVERPLHFDLD